MTTPIMQKLYQFRKKTMHVPEILERHHWHDDYGGWCQRCAEDTIVGLKPNLNSFHMRELLRKDVKFHWTQECDRELEYLKKASTKPPILRPIDPWLPIYVQVDSSKFGFGTAILQRDTDGNFYVIQYGAKATNPAQQKYNSDDLECMALIYALKSIEPIAINKPIIVITDNSHLLHLNTWNPINAKA